jgi:hypothetical protein
MSDADYALIGIDAVSILEVFSWGFGVVLLFWSIGFSLGVALDLIRKV